jgi:hypothetical protein
MYFPKFAAVGILAGLALVVMPFFILRVLVFFFIVRLIARLVMGHRFRRHYAYQHHYENRAEPLEAGDMRFFARRFEKEYQYNDKPRYSEKDLV